MLPSDNSGLAKPTTSPLAKCKVFTWSRFVIANKGNVLEFSSDIIAISCCYILGCFSSKCLFPLITCVPSISTWMLTSKTALCRGGILM